MQQTEQDLWNAFRAGDEAAYAALYHRFASLLHGYGYHLARDREVVADCVHDLFVYLHQHRRGLGPTDSIQFYLFRALRRRLAAHWEVASRFLHADHRNVGEADFEVVLPYENHMVQEEIRHQQQERLTRLVNQLPKRQKEALFLLYYSELTHAQIAELMSVKVETVYTLLSRALTLLRQHLKDLSVAVVLIGLL